MRVAHNGIPRMRSHVIAYLDESRLVDYTIGENIDNSHNHCVKEREWIFNFFVLSITFKVQVS